MSRSALRPPCWVVLGLMGLVVGCRSQASEVPVRPTKADLPMPKEPTSRWHFHPLSKARTTDTMELPGAVLEVDEAGTRWLRGSTKTPRPGPFGAPEPLVAVMPVDGKTAVVGESGAVYLSNDPLGPFVDVRSPPEKFFTTKRSGEVLVAIDRGGDVQRSLDAGLVWERVRTDAHFVDLMSDSSGHVLAYAVPERWYLSKDGAKTFERLQGPTIAPYGFLPDARGRIVAHGIYGAYSFGAGQLSRLPLSGAESARVGKEGREYTLPPGARASAIQEGRGALVGREFIEVRKSETKTWVLSGDFSRGLDKQEAEGLDECTSLRLASGARRTAIVCPAEEEGGVSPVLQFYVSEDGGRSFEQMSRVHRGAFPVVRLAVARDGRIAATGLCPRVEPEKGCVPEGIALLGSRETQFFSIPGVALPLHLAFDARGTLWAVGRRPKDGHIVLAGFSPTDLYRPTIVDLTRRAGFPPQTGQGEEAELAVFPGEGRTVAVGWSRNDALYVAALDGAGQVLGAGMAPPGAHSLAGAGRNIVALDPNDDVLWESSTGGLSWEKFPLPRRVCHGTRDCDVPVFCSSAGCLVGDELVRAGWGPAEAGATTQKPLSALADERMARAPGYSCRLSDEDWTTLPPGTRPPELSQASMGKAAWTLFAVTPLDASLESLWVERDQRRIQRRHLLAPVADASNYQLIPLPQVEGVAGARFRTPTGPRSGHGSLAAPRLAVEVAWENHFEDLTGHATLQIPALAPRSALFGLALRSKDDAAHLSVAGRGLYVRLTPDADQASTYFVTETGSGTSVEEIAPIRWPQGPDLAGGWLGGTSLAGVTDTEWVRAGGDHFALLQLEGSRVVVGASHFSDRGQPGTIIPCLMGLLSESEDGYAQRVSIGYLGREIGYVSAQVNLDGPGHRAAFVKLGGPALFHEPIPVPQQQDIRGSGRPCSDDERATTPRVSAPPELDKRRIVQIQISSSDLLELETEGAILYGTVEKPCVGAIEALSPDRLAPDETRYAALVFPGEVSWLFRRQLDALGQQEVSARPIECVGESRE